MNVRRVVRQGSSLAIGWGLIGVCVLLGVIFTFGHGGIDPHSACFLLAAALALWAVFVRPCLILATGGVGLHNIVRDVDLSWPVIDLIESRWNLKIFAADGRGWGSWAITTQRPTARGAVRTGGGSGLGLGRVSPEDLKDPTASASSVARTIQEAKADYERAVRQGQLARQEEQVRIRPAWPSIAALAAAVALIVIGILT
ncbi:hypothetical protein ATK17_2238 [Branchiibius hedensis]|uniref:PH domain-containing protein n=1 Tax=Branchiibius hedensis TaxID=672460 RepID=A0A2Y8ZTS1_9MICO|nr:hypothetical protein [Branchiibius hedensis]PWJ26094.1 hypothetical protein ATK17_2238 [Branchiibius hedensis]SSA34906.1 hypothetical protein SAMN04489750_2238 [Branchiibius hedensis]